MYELALKRDFIARHFLVGGDWGAENQEHSHHYALEVRLSSNRLDEHGFVADIVQVREKIEEAIKRFRDQTLNSLPEFKNLNPSIENLARICYRGLSSFLSQDGITGLEVEVWEDDIARVSYREKD